MKEAMQLRATLNPLLYTAAHEVCTLPLANVVAGDSTLSLALIVHYHWHRSGPAAASSVAIIPTAFACCNSGLIHIVALAVSGSIIRWRSID